MPRRNLLLAALCAWLLSAAPAAAGEDGSDPVPPVPMKTLVASTTHCTDAELKIAWDAIAPALFTTSEAADRTAQAAKDPSKAKSTKPYKTAAAIFGGPVPLPKLIPVLYDMHNTMDELDERLHAYFKVRAKTPDLGLRCATKADPMCNGEVPGTGVAYVLGNALPVHLCPKFFKAPVMERARTMVHESAHVAGIGQAKGETYCGPHVCTTVCGPPVVADAWSILVTCLNGPAVSN